MAVRKSESGQVLETVLLEYRALRDRARRVRPAPQPKIIQQSLQKRDPVRQWLADNAIDPQELRG